MAAGALSLARGKPLPLDCTGLSDANCAPAIKHAGGLMPETAIIKIER